MLNITVDTKLNWESHIDKINKRLSRILDLLRNLKYCIGLVPKIYLRTAYFAYFHSILKYGLLLWGNGPYIDRIFKLQKKIIRIITKSSPKECCKENIMTLISGNVLDLFLHAKDNIYITPTRSDIHSHDTREQANLDRAYA